MKLYANIKNERGGNKGTGDDTRIIVEMSYKNKIVGTIGLYSIRDGAEDLGYRIVWQDLPGLHPNTVLRQEETKRQTIQDKECTHQYCDDNGNCHACEVNVFK